MDRRPYRTNDDIRIVTAEERSKSADGRLNQSFPGMRRRDPKLQGFRGSSENLVSSEGNLLNEVVTDQEHTSVKNLVAMIEKSTRSESVNPYVRRWGCDLISPEPHKKEKTFRRERKEMPKQVIWHQQHGNHQGNNGQNYADYGSEADHDLSAHITDMDSLLGRNDYMNQTASTVLDGTMDGTVDEGPQRTATPVIWPPASPTPMDQHESRAPVIHRASPERPPSPPTQAVVRSEQQQQQRINYSGAMAGKQRSASTDTKRQSSNRVNNSSLTEIDQQISTIQNEFEAELDGLIDAYRKIQNNKQTNSQGWFVNYKN